MRAEASSSLLFCRSDSISEGVKVSEIEAAPGFCPGEGVGLGVVDFSERGAEPGDDFTGLFLIRLECRRSLA